MSSIGGRVTAMLQHLLLKLVTRLQVQPLVEQDAAVLAALCGCVAVIAAEVPHCSHEAPLKLSEVKLLQEKRPVLAVNSSLNRCVICVKLNNLIKLSILLAVVRKLLSLADVILPCVLLTRDASIDLPISSGSSCKDI
jgi:hypothetical protein